MAWTAWSVGSSVVANTLLPEFSTIVVTSDGYGMPTTRRQVRLREYPPFVRMIALIRERAEAQRMQAYAAMPATALKR